MKWLIFFLSFLTSTTILGQDCNFDSTIILIEKANQKGDFEEGERILDKLQSCNSLSNEQQIIRSGWVYKLRRNRIKRSKAHKLILKEKELLEKIGLEPDFEFKFLLAESYAARGDVENFNKIKGIDSISIIKHADKHYYLGRYFLAASTGVLKNPSHSAIAYLQKALSEFKLSSVNVPVYYLGITYQKLGNLNRNAGDVDKALAFYQKESDLYGKHYSANHFYQAICNYNIGNIYYEKQEFQLALNHYLKTFDDWKHKYKPQKRMMRYLTEAIGDMYWELGDQKNALKFFELSTTGEKVVNNDITEQSIHEADSLVEKGKYELALNYYKSAYDWREKAYGKHHPLTGACKNYVARAIASSGNIEASLLAYQDAINILVEEMDSPSWRLNPKPSMKVLSNQYLLESLIGKAELIKKLYTNTRDIDDLKTAFDTEETAVRILEKIRKYQLSESSYYFWTAQSAPLFESAIESARILYEKTNDKAYLVKAYRLFEKSKALRLLTAISNHPTAFANVPETILSQEKHLKSKINENKGRIASEEKRCGESRDKLLTLWRQQLLDLQNEFDVFQDKLKTSYPSYHKLKYNLEVADLQAVQQKLDRLNAGLLSYFVGTVHSYTIAITKNSITLDIIENSQTISEQAETLFNILNTQLHPHPQTAFHQFQNISSTLYPQIIPQHVVKSMEFEKIDRLIVSPSGKLLMLPFECLLTEKSNNQVLNYQTLPYLIKNYAISYSPSASVWMADESGKINTKYMGFAPSYNASQSYKDIDLLINLEHNGEEVEFASKLFEGEHWLNAKASEEVLKARASSAGILHLAMHGEMDDKEPMLSKLFLTPTDNEDGMLHTYEIYDLSIPAQLVILSACHTASGKFIRGEGILSLERAFHYAGSNSILSTLWAVDDASSSDLTQLFLKNLKSGMDKDLALQRAKLSYLETATPDKQHPFYWTSFRLSGQTASIKQTSNFLKWGAIVLLSLIILIFGIRKVVKIN